MTYVTNREYKYHTSFKMFLLQHPIRMWFANLYTAANFDLNLPRYIEKGINTKNEN